MLVSLCTICNVLLLTSDVHDAIIIDFRSRTILLLMLFSPSRSLPFVLTLFLFIYLSIILSQNGRIIRDIHIHIYICVYIYMFMNFVHIRFFFKNLSHKYFSFSFGRKGEKRALSGTWHVILYSPITSWTLLLLAFSRFYFFL